MYIDWMSRYTAAATATPKHKRITFLAQSDCKQLPWTWRNNWKFNFPSSTRAVESCLSCSCLIKRPAVRCCWGARVLNATRSGGAYQILSHLITIRQQKKKTRGGCINTVAIVAHMQQTFHSGNPSHKYAQKKGLRVYRERWKKKKGLLEFCIFFSFSSKMQRRFQRRSRIRDGHRVVCTKSRGRAHDMKPVVDAGKHLTVPAPTDRIITKRPAGHQTLANEKAQKWRQLCFSSLPFF